MSVSYVDTLDDLIAAYPTTQFALVFDAQGLNFITEDLIENIYCSANTDEERAIYSDNVGDLSVVDMVSANDARTSMGSVSISVSNPIMTRSITTLNLSVPFVSQSGHPLCWAASMSSIGYYLTGTSYSIYTIAGWAGMNSSNYEGLGTSAWVSLFSSHYGQYYTYYSNTTLTYSTIYTKLTNGRPIYMIGRRVDSEGEYIYHGVVVRGVYYNPSTGTRTTSFMDPSYSYQQYVTATLSVSGAWYFASDNGNSYKQYGYAA